MAKRKRKPVNNGAVLDIIIPVFNQPDFVRRCLESIKDTKLARVIVVDDASTEDIKAVVDDVLPGAKYIRNTENKGFPATVSRGVNFGRAKHVLLLNSDVVLEQGAIERMLDVLTGDESRIPKSVVDHPENAKVGVVSPKLLFADFTPHGKGGTIQHAGLAFDSNLVPFHLFLGWRADHPKANVLRSVQAVSGACMMFKRDVWMDIKKLSGDPMSAIYGRGTYEDMEFCIMARNVGYRVVYVPDACGTHHVGASAKDVGGYDLMGNYNIFKARMSGLVIWDGWYQV